MANVLLLDASALVYAYQAGGISLLNTYAQYAAASGYQLAVTDVVRDELLNYNGATNVVDWLDKQGGAVESTPESA